MGEDRERTASDIAAIERASRAGFEDGRNNEYDPDNKLASDTADQREAYGASWQKGYEER